MESVSVIIPTRNRKESLYQTLAALFRQKAAIHEVIVIDSSDVPIDASELRAEFDFGALCLLRAGASVCAQRNQGIRKATGDYILVLDDDIVVDDHYIERCLTFFQNHPSALVVSGLVVEQNESGKWERRWPAISFLRLIWSFVFQLSIWADPEEIPTSTMNGVLLRPLQRFYKRRGNGISRAGWPVLTNFSKPCFRTRIYFLCASIIKRHWLLANPYAEKLDQHGIGENYGISISLLPEQGVFVLSDICAYHHHSPANRLSENEAYYKRVLALDYFSRRQGSASRSWLVWSLIGNLLGACSHLQGDRVAKNCRLIWMFLRDRNPLLK